MRIGLDFDNTIVCYDQAIAQLADELLQIPAEVPRNKLALRDYLRSEDREAEWTSFQGELYGPGMVLARPFDGAIDAMLFLVRQGHELCIVSHRSRRPYAGKAHDLHMAARDWVKVHLKSAGLFCDDTSAVSFLETREEKVARISELNCQAFVDDLPSVLQSIGCTAQVIRILFDPTGTIKTPIKCYRIKEWAELKEVLE